MVKYFPSFTFPFFLYNFSILYSLLEIKEIASQTSRYHQQQTQKELDKKRPGILKDSSYINNPIANYGKQERSSERQNPLTSKEKMTTIAPMTTRNQQNIPPESSLVKFYSPNGMSQAQFAFGSRTNEYNFINFKDF